MRDIINIHVGQAGVQIGSALWELFCLEHEITEDGRNSSGKINVGENIETFFTRSSSERFVPRGLFIDLEPTVIDELRTGSFRNLYHPNRLISGPEDASSNFARGFFTIGKLLLDMISREIRKLFEASSFVQGFLIFRSLGGGTGSGLTSAVFDGLTEYPKTPKIEIPIYPSPTLSTSTVEPYNSIIAEHFCLEDIDVGLLFDNEALFEICTNYLNITRPSYSTINRLISQICSSITASMRFDNVLNCDLTVLNTNLVPYPRIHFPLCNFAPILPPEKISCEPLTVKQLTEFVFERDNQMMKIDTTYGRYMSCALFYRGALSPKDVYEALLGIKRSKAFEFVEWCPTGFKVGINNSIPAAVSNSKLSPSKLNVAMLTNSSAIGQAWQRLCHKFYLLYSKRSFLHWFVGEGMDECEFTEALYNISTLVKDYEEVVMDSPKSEPTVIIDNEPVPINEDNQNNQNNRCRTSIDVRKRSFSVNEKLEKPSCYWSKSCF